MGEKNSTLPPPNGASFSRQKVNRSRVVLLRTFAILASIGFVGRCLTPLPASTPPHVSTVDDVLRGAPLIDGHNDFPIAIRDYYQNQIYNENFTEDTLKGQVDFPRLHAGRVGGQFWSVYVDCPNATYGDHSDAVYYMSVHDTLQQIDLVNRLISRFPEHLVRASTAEDVWIEHAGNPAPKRVSSFMGIEGLHQIGNSASTLRLYHSLGVRYATLTHTCHNMYADSESPTAGKAIHGGLSDAGKAMVKEMNRLGMIVDISHTSAETQAAALDASEAPVIFSHSGSYHVQNHTRNVPDSVLHQLKANDGVIMTVFLPLFITGSEKASLDDVVKHILYIGRTIGFRHVGLGSDFDGMGEGVSPKGLEDVSKYPDLIRALIEKGVTVEEMRGVVGGNVLRVLEEVERVAKKMQESGLVPLEDAVPKMYAS